MALARRHRGGAVRAHGRRRGPLVQLHQGSQGLVDQDHPAQLRGASLMFKTIALIFVGILVFAGLAYGLVLFLRKRAEKKASETPERMAARKAADAKLAATSSRRNA